MEEALVGEPCDDDGACGGGCCLPEHDGAHFRHGFCSITECDSDDDCPGDSVCATDHWPWSAMESYCAPACDAHHDCREPEYACLATPSGAQGCQPNFW